MRSLTFALLAVTVIAATEDSIKPKICEPGTRSKEACSECICSMDGTSKICMPCPHMRRRRQEIDTNCTLGQTLTFDCSTGGNYCECGMDGSELKWTCREIDCPSHYENRYYKREAMQRCRPGETTMRDCNSCFCTPDGLGWACTMMACPPKTCQPGSSYKKYCNTCYCGADGHSKTCTTMACPYGMYNEDGSRRNSEQLPREPSQTF